jgi:ATP-dependent Clp protease ATP-binding subunit ClpX
MGRMENVRRYRKAGIEQFIKVVHELPVLPPKQLFARLAEAGYRGQDAARRAVSLMAYRHVRRIKRLHEAQVPRELVLPKTNYLFLGPTGSGKTHLVELLFAGVLKLPTVIVDITTYSETGYVGQDPSTIVTRLLHAADDNPLVASIGIICLDEFDKIASGQNNAIFAGAGTTKDVTGMGVQRELLKMLEAGEVVVPTELTHSTYGDHVVMSTADVTFIACGAFSGFREVVRRRGGAAGTIGFGQGTGAAGRKGKADAETIAVSLAADEVEDVANFQAYGFLPELIARFSRVVPFLPLDAATLKEILHASVIDKLKREFADEGFELVIEEAVLDHVVGESIARQTGARGLASILTRHIESVAFDTFADHPGGEIRMRMIGGAVDIDVTSRPPAERP